MSYNERLKRGFNTYLAAHGDDTPLESALSALQKMPPPTSEDIPDMPPPASTNKIPDVEDNRINILPVVVFVLSAEEYAALCEGDEN